MRPRRSNEDTFKRFENVFHDIVDATYAAIRREPLPADNTHTKFIFNYLMRSFTYEQAQVIRNLDKEELSQEIALIWFELMETHKKTKPNVWIRQYLIRMSSWQIRDYLKKKIRWGKKEYLTNETFDLDREEEKEDIGLRLDLSFLLYGTDVYPFSGLSNHDRLLLYLMFCEDKNYSQIGVHIHKYRTVVKQEVESILKYLKESM